jgi:hypothetical protein
MYEPGGANRSSERRGAPSGTEERAARRDARPAAVGQEREHATEVRRRVRAERNASRSGDRDALAGAALVDVVAVAAGIEELHGHAGSGRRAGEPLVSIAGVEEGGAGCPQCQRRSTDSRTTVDREAAQAVATRDFVIAPAGLPRPGPAHARMRVVRGADLTAGALADVVAPGLCTLRRARTLTGCHAALSRDALLVEQAGRTGRQRPGRGGARGRPPFRNVLQSSDGSASSGVHAANHEGVTPEPVAPTLATQRTWYIEAHVGWSPNSVIT